MSQPYRPPRPATGGIDWINQYVLNLNNKIIKKRAQSNIMTQISGQILHLKEIYEPSQNYEFIEFVFYEYSEFQQLDFGKL
jgi:hypothetical protein